MWCHLDTYKNIISGWQAHPDSRTHAFLGSPHGLAGGRQQVGQSSVSSPTDPASAGSRCLPLTGSGSPSPTPCPRLSGDKLCHSLSMGCVQEGPPYSSQTVSWSCAVAIGRFWASSACTPGPDQVWSGIQGWWGTAEGPVWLLPGSLRPSPQSPPPSCGDGGKRSGLGPGLGGPGQRS